MYKIKTDKYKPKFICHKENGIFPKNLTFGFENELEFRKANEYKPNSHTEDIFNFVIDNNRFIYAKDDFSLNDGVEINSHPFNYNWFLKNDVLVYLDALEDRMKASRNCGFHVHIGRNYLTKEHLINMVKFFYANPKFLESISLRENLLYFCYPYIMKKKKKIDFNLKKNCIALIKNPKIHSRHVALNLNPKKTVEVRIFQGTNNKELIKLYLNMVLAIVLYTKKEKFESISVDNFKAFVYKNRKSFKSIIKSKFLQDYKWNWKMLY